MIVPFLDFKQLYYHYADDVDTAIKRSLITGKLILQEDVEIFEQDLAKFLGVSHVVAVASGTDALRLSLIVANVGPGDEVITVSHTFIATIEAIKHVGATPVLVDVDEDGLIDISQVRDVFNKKTKAVIPVHLAGDYVREFSFMRDVPIIEDACQAIGAKGVGFGDTQCYSFYPAKILGCYGDGGAVATNDERVADRIRSLRNHGGVTKYDQDTYEYGYNSRLDNIQAAILVWKLKRLTEDLEKRKQIADVYNDVFEELPIKLPVNREGRVWQDYVIQTPDAKELAGYLKDQGVETLGVGMTPNHKHKGLGLEKYKLPMTEKIVAESVRLPCNQFMTERQISYVLRKVRAFYKV